MSKFSRRNFLELLAGSSIGLALASTFGKLTFASPTQTRPFVPPTIIREGLKIESSSGVRIMDFDSSTSSILVGGTENSGSELVLHGRGVSGLTGLYDRSLAAIHISGNSRRMVMRDDGSKIRCLLDSRNPSFVLFNQEQRPTFYGNGVGGRLAVGGNGGGGDIIGLSPEASYEDDSQLRSILNAQTRFQIDSASATARIGGSGQEGRLMIFSRHNSNISDTNANLIDLYGGDIRCKSFALYPFDTPNASDLTGSKIRLYGQSGNMDLDGGILLKQGNLHLSNGNISLAQGRIDLAQGGINLAQGDLVLGNADCAEEFESEESSEVDPGSVMILADQEESVRLCDQAYDQKVAGVVSGAGDYKPGLILDKKTSSEGKRIPIALMGKVFCKVDADDTPIERGDLLTTSNTLGHAMKAADPSKAFGATIGKALRSSHSGRDLIPILVSLQ